LIGSNDLKGLQINPPAIYSESPLRHRHENHQLGKKQMTSLMGVLVKY
jgi:hypothetical protein